MQNREVRVRIFSAAPEIMRRKAHSFGRIPRFSTIFGWMEHKLDEVRIRWESNEDRSLFVNLYSPSHIIIAFD